jgi:hypothetical protein
MEKWEYLTIQLERGEEKGKVVSKKSWEAGHLTKQQNEYGQQGWELVSMFCPPLDMTFGNTGGDSTVFASFKRKVIS